MASTNFKTLARQIQSSRIKYVYVALCEIRKKYMKDVPVLIEAGLVRRILELVRIRDNLEEQYRSKVIEMSMSILGNLCMDDLTRKEVLKEKGLSYLVELYDESECVELLTRVCRCLSNMLLDPRSWKLVACVTVMEKTVKLLKDSEKEENKLTYIRAIRLLGQTDLSMQKLVQQNAVGGVMKYIDDDSTKLKEAAFRCIHSLSNHRCCSDFASQVKTSGKLSTLLELVKKHDVRTFNLIIRLCEHHSFRAEFGNLGGIDILLEIVSTETGLDNHWVFDSLSVLCLCCKEVVNRVKLKDKNILPVIMKSLSDNRYSSLHPRIVSALVCFLYDNTGFEILLECDLVPIVMRRLRQYYEPNREPDYGNQKTKGKMVATSNQEPECSEKEAIERMEAKPDEKIAMELENEPKSVEFVANTNTNATDGAVESTMEVQKEVKELEIARGNKFDTENIDGEKEVADIDLVVEMKSYAENQSETKPASSSTTSTKPVYSMHSPTYQSGSTWKYEDDSNVTCIARFTPPPFFDGINSSSYSPISNSSYYSPSEGSPGYSSSSPETSPRVKSTETGSQPLSRSNTHKYSSIVCQLYKSPASPDYGNSSPTRMSRQDYDCYSSGYTSMSPGGKSPSPSGLFDISEDPATFTYSPVHSDVESEVEDMDNNMHEVKDTESVTSQKVEETCKNSDNDSKIEDGSKQMGRNIEEISRKDFETKTGDENNDDKNENLSETMSGIRKEENDERNETTDVVNKAFDELTDKDDAVGSGIDFSKVFLELDKGEQCNSSSNKRKSPDDADRITEFNILILLSRVSQMTEPTKHLVTMEVMDGLLDYIGKMDSPLARCPRLLSRIFRNPLCFQSVLSLHVPVLIWDKILQHENLETVVDSIKDHRRKVNSMSDRFTDTSLHQASKRRKTSEDQSFSYKGLDHKQEVDFCETGSSAMAFLEDLSGVVDSNFGRGMIEKLLYSAAENQKTDICINLLYITWTQASRQYLFHQRFIDTITQVLSPSEDINSQQFISTINGFRVLFHVMNTKTKYQHSTVSKPNANGCHGNRFKTSKNSKTGVATFEKTRNEEDIVSAEETNTKETVKNCSLKQVNDLDIVFIVEGQKVLANKSTMCSKSEIFSAMLEGYYSEASLSEIPVVGCPKLAFEIVIHYLHGCSIATCEIMKDLYTQAVTFESASICIALLNESHKYLLHDLHSLAMNCLLSRYIIPESAFSAFKYAVLHRNDKLMKACVSCVFYDSKCCTEAVKSCQEFLTSRYSGLFFHTLTDVLLE